MLERHAEVTELGPGHVGHGDVAAAAIEPGSDCGLQEPADPGPQRPEHDAPLLAVDVVDEDDDRTATAGPQPGQERHAVVHLDDDVRAAEAVSSVHERRPQVDALVATAADDPRAARPGFGRVLRRDRRR